ncbi:DsbA family protein [Haladaptatus cibarius]|uniref:DsbA family protein n=1 Tax=Haladaptatus cibarius TaxID=453847 RepID=UPI000A7B077F|nr:thioredoxin domain-containing protein [Haladaptatus cibarius]
MTDDTMKRRRQFLGATATLVGLAGCTSSLPQSDNTTTPRSEPAQGDTRTGESGGSLSYASDETTGYGIDLQDNPILGSEDATVDIYYWTDYQCPFCNRFEQMTFPRLVDKQIQPGTVRFVVLELPNVGNASETAARMSKCVWRQVRDDNPGAFKRWHSTVFDEQEKPNTGWASKSNLLDITRSVDGVDAEAVQSCLKDEQGSLKSSVSGDINTGKESDISVTPGFILFNRESEKAGKIVGAQPYKRFESSIQKIQNA